MPTRSDNLALAERIIGGDQEGAREFEIKYGPRFESRARRAGIPNQDCSDVVQEIFLTVINQLRRGLFRGDSSLGTWLDRVVSGNIVDYWRSRQAENGLISSATNEAGEEIALVEMLPAPPIDHAAVLAVRQALERMPAELRVVLVLKRCEGLTLEEIGSGLKRPIATVYRKVVEAEEVFRRLIVAGDDDPAASSGSKSLSEGK